MDTPRRRSGRLLASDGRKSLRNRSLSQVATDVSDTPDNPKVKVKSVRKAQEDSPQFSPKKLRKDRTPSLKALQNHQISPASEDKKPFLRETRRRSKAPKELEASTETPKKAKKAKKLDLSPDAEQAESSEEDDSFISKTKSEAKPTTLFEGDEDVEGEKMFSFRTPKKKDSMALLAQHTPKTPRHNHPKPNKETPRTPKSTRLSEIQNTPTSRPSALKLARTPRHVREANKTKLMKQQLSSESEGDFLASDSDFNPQESSEESSDEEEAECENEGSPPQKVQSVAARILKTPSVATSSRQRTRSDFQYVLQSDDYFATATTNTKTSNHTLDRLKNSRVAPNQLLKLMKEMKLSFEHEQAVKSLNEEHKTHFDKWLTLFDEGYTVLLYGFGSKRNLIQSFHNEKLSEEHVIVINGFFPSLTIKDILDSIWVDFLEQPSMGGNPHEIVNMIKKEVEDIPALNLFLIVHNIDGMTLRNDKAQSVLSRLASIKNIHMIASIDHINTPLLWNNTKLSNFNFAWFDVTSFLPYVDETALENSLMVQSSGAMELSAMKSVFLSLTANARGIYVLLIKHHLENSKSSNSQGILFKDLYSACRDAFLVSSPVALRAQLTEFLDHQLARLKRTIDGAESVTIPIKNYLLEQFLSETN